jgi:hypothetical protein
MLLVMSRPNFLRKRINHFFHDFCEMAAKKSQIFLLPFHKNRGKNDNEGSKFKSMINAQKNPRFFLSIDHRFEF